MLYRVAQNHGKQVLRISHIKFHFTIIQFVVIPHGQRDLSSLPCLGGAAVQISLKILGCRVADVISSRMTKYWKEPLTKNCATQSMHMIIIHPETYAK